MNPIRHHDADKTLLVRDNIVLAFFCKHPFPEMAAGVKDAFEIWLKIVPKDLLKWSLIGASATQYKELHNRTIGQCLALLDPTKAAQRDLTAFQLQGQEKYNPGYQFATVGNRNLQEDNDNGTRTNMAEMRFPTELVQEWGVARFVDLAIEIARCLPYDSGYASPALNWGKESKRLEAGRIIVPLALRHPGFDVNLNHATRFKLGRYSRGARWLTFLSHDLVAELGGRDSLSANLDQAIEVLEAGNGIVLCAGSEPEVGDLNRQEDLPLLRSIAHAIEKVTFFGDQNIERRLFEGDGEKLDRWERRFLL